jgi:hypothetical protein
VNLLFSLCLRALACLWRATFRMIAAEPCYIVRTTRNSALPLIIRA